MEKRIRKKIKTVLATTALAMIPLCVGGAVNKTAAVKAETEVKTLKVDFSNASDAELFDAYYSADGESATLVDFDDYWEIRDGKLYSKVSVGYNSLILKDYGLQSYEMSVDYTSSGGDGYLALLSKMRRKGVSSRGVAATAYREYGHGVFVTDSGEAVMQGDFRSMGITDEEGIVKGTVSSYNAAETHNLYVRCINADYTMKVDDKTVVEKRNAGGGIGFMGIQAVNSAGSFDNLSVVLLDPDGNAKDILPDDDVIRVACVGDSLTFGSGNGSYNGNDTTPGFLQKMLGDGYDVRNFGLGGRTAILGSNSCIMYSDGSNSLPSAEYEMAKKYQADIIYIMLGTNDSQTTAGYWGTNEESGAQLFKEGYQQVIDGLLENNPDATVYLLIPPTYRHTGLPQLTEEMIATRARVYVPIIAEDNGFEVIDANEVTKDLDTSHLFDYIHFDPYGYSLIAGAVYDQIALDATETLTLPYGEEGITLEIGEETALIQSSRTNPRWLVMNDALATIDDNGTLTAQAAGETTVVATLGNQKVNVKLCVKNNFRVNKVTAKKTSLVYGDSLPALTVDAPVSGEIGYVDGETPKMGEATYRWIFTPKESIYAPVYGEITLTYAKAKPEAAAPNVPKVTYENGMKLSSVLLPEGYVWKDAELAVKEGKNTAEAVFVPADSEHYENASFIVTFRAVKIEQDQSPWRVVLYLAIGLAAGVAVVVGGWYGFRFLKKKTNKKVITK